jgi:hypothetical protein
MEKSRGAKKALKAVLTAAALVAALATTGCAGGTLMGPDTSTTSSDQVASQGGQLSHPGGQLSKP